VKKSKPFGCLVRKYNEIASCALTIGSPPVWPKSYERNSVPRNVASLGALSVVEKNYEGRTVGERERYQNIYSHTFQLLLSVASREVEGEVGGS
jgi:hypothetical protein